MIRDLALGFLQPRLAYGDIGNYPGGGSPFSALSISDITNLKEATENRYEYFHGKSYVEGGNVLTTKLANGDLKVIIGETSLILSTFLLDSLNEFNLNQVMSVAQALSNADSITYEILRDIGIISNELSEEERIRTGKEFLAKVEITKRVIAHDFGIEANQIIFIPQPGYHIDLFLRSGPNGTIFFNEFRLIHS